MQPRTAGKPFSSFRVFHHLAGDIGRVGSVAVVRPVNAYIFPIEPIQAVKTTNPDVAFRVLRQVGIGLFGKACGLGKGMECRGRLLGGEGKGEKVYKQGKAPSRNILQNAISK